MDKIDDEEEEICIKICFLRMGDYYSACDEKCMLCVYIFFFVFNKYVK